MAARDLKQWLKKVDLPYHSPHKFRHGNAVYSLKNSKNIHALKAVSQNLMHSNLSITDVVYGILSEKDIKEQIICLGQNKEDKNSSNQSIEILLEQLLEKLKEGRA